MSSMVSNPYGFNIYSNKNFSSAAALQPSLPSSDTLIAGGDWRDAVYLTKFTIPTGVSVVKIVGDGKNLHVSNTVSGISWISHDPAAASTEETVLLGLLKISAIRYPVAMVQRAL